MFAGILAKLWQNIHGRKVPENVWKDEIPA